MSKATNIFSNKVLVGNLLQPATLHLHEGKIDDITLGLQGSPQLFGDLVIMPGLIDSHVHINEPGTDWEGFDSATKAAAAGGITTLVDMPLNSIPVTVDRDSLDYKIKVAKRNLHVNCGFWGGIIPTSIDHIGQLWSGGVLGFKSFLINSGLDAFPNMEEPDLHKAFKKLSELNAMLLVHCEIQGDGAEESFERSPTSYSAFLASRPTNWENNAISLIIEMSQTYDVAVHVVHLSSAESIDQIYEAKNRGVKITVETCPHYLFFNAEDIPKNASLYKCTPPIRSHSNNEQLWNAVKSSLIDFIVSDHSPCPAAMKYLDDGNLEKAWGGISGIQFGLSLIWTKAKTKGLEIPDISNLMSRHVANFLDLGHKKGLFEKGYDADIVIWDPNEEFLLEEKEIFFRHKISPYVGVSLTGKVKQTYVGGHLVYDHGEFINLHKGQIILR